MEQAERDRTIYHSWHLFLLHNEIFSGFRNHPRFEVLIERVAEEMRRQRESQVAHYLLDLSQQHACKVFSYRALHRLNPALCVTAPRRCTDVKPPHGAWQFSANYGAARLDSLTHATQNA
ncbi:MAG: hypothetical protein WD795_09995 [Woeseia sp.]